MMGHSYIAHEAEPPKQQDTRIHVRKVNVRGRNDQAERQIPGRTYHAKT